MLNWEPAAERGLWTLSDPRLSNPAKMRKKYCLVNIAVCPRLQLISHTQPTSTLSRIKCERYIFIKKCVRSFVRSFVVVCHYCRLCSTYICICMWLIFFHHTTCESTCDTLSSSAANQGDNTVLVAQGGTATPGTIKQLLPPDRVFNRNIYLYIHQIN